MGQYFNVVLDHIFTYNRFFFFNQHALKKFLQKITWVEIYLFLFEKTAQLDKFNNFIKIHGKE